MPDFPFLAYSTAMPRSIKKKHQFITCCGHVHLSLRGCRKARHRSWIMSLNRRRPRRAVGSSRHWNRSSWPGTTARAPMLLRMLLLHSCGSRISWRGSRCQGIGKIRANDPRTVNGFLHLPNLSQRPVGRRRIRIQHVRDAVTVAAGGRIAVVYGGSGRNGTHHWIAGAGHGTPVACHLALPVRIGNRVVVVVGIVRGRRWRRRGGKQSSHDGGGAVRRGVVIRRRKRMGRKILSTGHGRHYGRGRRGARGRRQPVGVLHEIHGVELPLTVGQVGYDGLGRQAGPGMVRHAGLAGVRQIGRVGFHGFSAKSAGTSTVRALFEQKLLRGVDRPEVSFARPT